MSQQLFDILQVMIRHMRDAEGLVFQLAVAIGEESLLTQLMVEISHTILRVLVIAVKVSER